MWSWCLQRRGATPTREMPTRTERASHWRVVVEGAEVSAGPSGRGWQVPVSWHRGSKRATNDRNANVPSPAAFPLPDCEEMPPEAEPGNGKTGFPTAYAMAPAKVRVAALELLEQKWNDIENPARMCGHPHLRGEVKEFNQ